MIKQIHRRCEAINVVEYSTAVDTLANKLKSIDSFKDELDTLVASIGIEENIYAVRRESK